MSENPSAPFAHDETPDDRKAAQAFAKILSGKDRTGALELWREIAAGEMNADHIELIRAVAADIVEIDDKYANGAGDAKPANRVKELGTALRLNGQRDERRGLRERIEQLTGLPRITPQGEEQSTTVEIVEAMSHLLPEKSRQAIANAPDARARQSEIHREVKNLENRGLKKVSRKPGPRSGKSSPQV